MHASLLTGGPFIEIWRRDCNMSFFSLLRSLVLLHLSLARRWKWKWTDSTQLERRAEERSERMRVGLSCSRWRVQVVVVVSDFPSQLDFSWKVCSPLNEIELELSPFCLQLFSIDISFVTLFHSILRKEVLNEYVDVTITILLKAWTSGRWYCQNIKDGECF